MEITLRGKTIVSEHSDTEACELLADCKGDFAASLYRQYRTSKRGLSQKQLDWVHFLVYEMEHPTPKADKIDLGVSLSELVARFDLAGSKLKYPKLHFDVDGQHVMLGRAGNRAKFPGSLNITDGGRYGENEWFGRIHRDGRFEPSRKCTPEIVAFLKFFADDPEAALLKHAKTGNCPFCNSKLSDPISVVLGYGRTCGKNWGLKWGKKLAVAVLKAAGKSDDEIESTLNPEVATEPVAV